MTDLLIRQPTRESATRAGFVANAEAIAVPAPKLPTLATYRKWSAAKRAELNQRRVTALDQMTVVKTTQLVDVEERIRVQLNAKTGPPPHHGLLIDGEPAIGKTTALLHAAYGIHRELTERTPWPDPNITHVPIVYVSVAAGSTGRLLMKQLVEALGFPLANQKATYEQFLWQATGLLRDLGTQCIILDEIHNLDLNLGRAGTDAIKDLQNKTTATLVLGGIDARKSKAFNDTRSDQLVARFSTIEMTTLPIDTKAAAREWQETIKGIEARLPLLGHTPGSLAATSAGYLYERTQGRMGSVLGLLRLAAHVAMTKPTELKAPERIDEKLLDTLRADDLAEKHRKALSRTDG